MRVALKRAIHVLNEGREILYWMRIAIKISYHINAILSRVLLVTLQNCKVRIGITFFILIRVL